MIDETMLIKHQGDICLGTIEEWAAASTNEYLFGSSLISNLYLIFVVSALSGGNSIGFASRASSHAALSPGIIAGISLGSVVVLALIGILVVLIYYVRRKRASSPQMTSIANPYIFNTLPATPGREQFSSLLRSMSPPPTPDWHSNFDGQSTVTPHPAFSIASSTRSDLVRTQLQSESDAPAGNPFPPSYQFMAPRKFEKKRLA